MKRTGTLCLLAAMIVGLAACQSAAGAITVPTVTGLSANTGSADGGTPIEITGTGFSGTTRVTVGGTAATSIAVVNDTALSYMTPPGTAGTVDVRVTNDAGTSSAVSADHFTYASVNIVSNGLVRHFQARRAKDGRDPGSNNAPTRFWHDLMGTLDGVLHNFDWTTASGWAGSGTPADPYCLVYDGADDWVNLGASNLAADKTCSFEIWLNYTPSAIAPPRFVFDENSISNTNPGQDVRLDGSDVPFTSDWDDANHTVSVTATEPKADAWHQIVSVADGTHLRLYVDGVEVGTAASLSSLGPETDTQLSLGNTTCGSATPVWTYYVVRIAVFRAYSRGLSAAEVLQNCEAGINGDTAAPLANPVLTLKLTGLTSGVLRSGQRLIATGTVTPPSLAGSTVALSVQRSQGGVWRWVSSMARTIAADGAYGARYKPVKTGTYRIRATVAASATNAAGTTKWLVFRMR